MDRKFFYAIDVWENRTTASYRPLYEPYHVGDGPRMTVFDPYGRQLGDPNFYDWRPPCKEEVDVDLNVRYFTFRDAEGRVLLYKEDGYSAEIDEATSAANEARAWAEGGDEEVQALGGTHSAKAWQELAADAASTATLEAADAVEAASEAEKWAEGTDAQVEELGGEHSAKTWQELAEFAAAEARDAASEAEAVIAGNRMPGVQSGQENHVVVAKGQEDGYEVSEVDLDDVALRDGYYPTLGAGTAENLVDPRAQGVDRIFAVDTSCGEASIADNGNALVDVQKGRTVVWNQLLNRNQTDESASGLQYSFDNAAGRVSISGRLTSVSQHRIGDVSVVKDHSYLLLGTAYGYCSSGNTWNMLEQHGKLQFFGLTFNGPLAKVAVASENYDGQGFCFHPGNLKVGTELSVILYANVFDLTQMFGKGREPTAEQFRSMFPEISYEYTASPYLINYRGSGIKTIGFNQYTPSDDFIRVRPQPYQITGTYAGLNFSPWPLRSAPAVLTLNQTTTANTLYSYGNGYYTACVPIAAYDATATYRAGDVCVHDGAWYTAIVDIPTAEAWDGTHWETIGEAVIGNAKYFHSHVVTPDAEGVFTPSDFGWLYVLGGNDTDTCVHFTWSGYRNGDYEEYWSNTKELNVAQWFPEGMNGVGDVHDELYANRAVQRWGSVDLGTLDWKEGSSAGCWYVASADMPAYNTARDTEMRCSRYAFAGSRSASPWYSDVDKEFTCYGHASVTNVHEIYLRDSTYSTAADLKVALSGVTLYYELVTPVTTPIDPAQPVVYPVSDFGTESLLPPAPQSMPFLGVVKYSTDYTRELTRMIDEDVRGEVHRLKAQMPEKADKDGDYRQDGLIANAAGNLIDANATAVPASFAYRITAGDESVAAQGVADIQDIKGATCTYNQLAEDYHVNTAEGYGEVAMDDAKGGSPVSNVFRGETVVSNQLVPPSTEKEVSGSGLVELPAAAGSVRSCVVEGDAWVRNQLLKSSSADNWEAYNPSYASFSASDGTMTMTAIAAGTINYMYGFRSKSEHNIVAGHKYLIYGEFKASAPGFTRVAHTAFSANGNVIFLNGGTEWQSAAGAVLTASASSTRRTTAYFTADSSSLVPQVGDTLSIRNFMLVDLTQLCNGDAEKIAAITSWDDLVAQYPEYASYVAYNAGEIAGVQSSVQMTGKNLQPKATELKTVAGVTFTPNEDGSISVSGTPTTEAVYLMPRCYFKQGSVLTASGISSATNIIWGALLLYDKDDNNLYNSGGSSSTKLTVDTSLYPAAAYAVLRFKRNSNNVAVSGKIYPQVEFGSSATAYEPYHDGGAASTETLYAAGTARDLQDVVSGGVTRRIGSVDMGTLTWTYVAPTTSYPSGRFYASINGKQPGMRNFICSRYPVGNISASNDRYIHGNETLSAVTVVDSSLTQETISAALSGVMLYYELAAPATSTVTAQPLATSAGSNVIYEVQSTTAGAPITASYDTTAFDLALDGTHSYYVKLSGAESVQTGLSTLAVDATQDKVMDLTRCFTADVPTTVAELKARYPGVASLGAYDRGSFVHLSGGTWTTGVWNQRIQNGNFINTDSWVPYNATLTVSGNSLSASFDHASTANKNVSQTLACTVGHQYMLHFDYKTDRDWSGQYLYLCTGLDLQARVDQWPVPEWTTVDVLCTAVNEAPKLYFFINNGELQKDVTSQLRNVMLIDLTALFGAGNEPTTVQEVRDYCAAIGKPLTQYQAYDTGTAIGGTVDLTGMELKGAGAWADTYDAETGEYVQNTATATAPNNTANWQVYSNGNNRGFSCGNALPVIGAYSCIVTDDFLPNTLEGNSSGTGINVWAGTGANQTLFIEWASNSEKSAEAVPAEWLVDGDIGTPNLDGFKTWLADHPFDMTYKRGTATTTIIPQQPVALRSGFNALYQTSTGTLQSRASLRYEGTSWQLRLVRNRKYLLRHEGEYALLSPTADAMQDVVSGDKLVDLSWWFGRTADVPATLDEVFSLFPQLRGEMPYMFGGKLCNFNGAAVRTVGFNQWDGTFSETGKALNNQGEVVSANNLSITSYIRVVGGLEYEITHAYGAHYALCWYDIGKNLVSVVDYLISSGTAAKRAFAPANACWARFTLLTADAANEVFHLCWSGYRNYGTDGYAYEPYRESTRELPVATYFPDGMGYDPVSGRYDELRKDRAIQRVYRKVLTGDETWSGPSTSSGNRYFTMTAANLGSNAGTYARLTGSQFTVQCNIVPNYGGGFTAQTAASSGSLYWSITAASGSLYFMLPYGLYDVVTTAAQMKQYCKDRYDAGDPIVIQWPLATPVEIPIEDALALSYDYEDFGTEELLPANPAVLLTAPANFDVQYQLDFTRTVATLPKNFISKESLENLNAQLAPAMGGTIAMTYNAETEEFDFTFTKSASVIAIAAATSAVSLQDGMTYTHTPSASVTYSLPAVADSEQPHDVVLDLATSGSSITFKDASGSAVAPQRAIDVTAGRRYRIVCSWCLGAWAILPVEVG